MKIKFHFLILAVFLSVLFISAKQSFSDTRNFLLEYATGTWCGQCPCGDRAAEQILVTFPNTIFIAYHGPHNIGIDPFANFIGDSIINSLGFVGYPTGVLDRNNDPYIYDYDYWFPGVKSEYLNNRNTVISVAITSKNYNPATRVLTAAVNSTALQSLTGQYKINFVITENNVVYYQSSSGICNGGLNYVHKWIARNMANGQLGENLNTGTWNQNQVITKSLNTTLDISWVDANCNLIVFVYKDASPLYLANVSQALTVPVTVPLGIQEEHQVPKDYNLSQNYPNPFNPTTNIKFAVPKDGIVSLKICDVTGSIVQVYADGFMKSGTYNTEVDASSLASGVYFYTLRAGDFIQTKKMVVIK